MCLSSGGEHGLRQQQTPTCDTYCEGCFDTYTSFLGCEEVTKSIAKVIFHIGFSPFCQRFCSGKIGFPKLFGNTISRTNTLVAGVKLSTYTCFSMAFQNPY